MNDFAFLLFTTQKYSSFNPPYFPKRTLKFFLNSIPACSEQFIFTGWRLKLMNLYSWSGTLLFWSAGFRISIKGQQASRAEAPILVGAPHSSFLEALIIYMCGSSPVSRHENKTAFLISACQIFYQAIFVDR